MALRPHDGILPSSFMTVIGPSTSTVRDRIRRTVPSESGGSVPLLAWQTVTRTVSAIGQKNRT
eukprot:745018-Hanusia_phi.AAC.1